MKDKGLTKEQADRILEDFESLTLALKLVQQLVEQIGNDIVGMRNGNQKEV
jgi:hypothetical protein